MTLTFWLLLYSMLLPLQGLDLLDQEEVEYVRFEASASPGDSVTLSCGSSVPSIFIWGFTKPGTDANVALAYNYGHGVKLQPQTGVLGRSISVPDGAAELRIGGVRRGAAGTFTCQALYDTENGPRITFYFTRLDLEDE